MSGSDIIWAICKSAPHSILITMPLDHQSVFFTSRMPFLPPNQQRQSTEGTSWHRYQTELHHWLCLVCPSCLSPEALCFQVVCAYMRACLCCLVLVQWSRTLWHNACRWLCDAAKRRDDGKAGRRLQLIVVGAVHDGNVCRRYCR